jgi:Rrf2 family protein
MKLSRTIAYGIHATVQLARAVPGLPIPCSQLAREGQMPERFLVQILRSLVTHGLLESTCGVAGGYSLSRPAAQITLRDIVEAFDNPLKASLPSLIHMGEKARSAILQTLNAMSQAACAELQKLTVADLVRLDFEPAIAHHADATATIDERCAIVLVSAAQPGQTAVIR